LAYLEAGHSRITLVRAGSYWWDGGAMFGVVPKTLWSRHQPCDEWNRIEAGFNCFVVEHGGKRVLIETGGGVRHDERARERMRLPQPPAAGDVLRAHGFEPESIDIAINTHLHWDHAGGNTVDEGSDMKPSFRNALYLTQRGELLHAREQHPRDAVSYRAPNYEPLIDSGRMQLLDGDSEVLPGIEVRVVPGHNRHMMIVLVRSAGQTWCHLADLIPYSAQISPGWVSGFDLFPLESIENKVRTMAEAAAQDWWCSFGHDPSVAFAKIGMREGKWQIHQTRA
jgi:glyoxylase-like metal-dependent hydrolase (beta-lactamase superfamily II)